MSRELRRAKSGMRLHDQFRITSHEPAKPSPQYIEYSASSSSRTAPASGHFAKSIDLSDAALDGHHSGIARSNPIYVSVGSQPKKLSKPTEPVNTYQPALSVSDELWLHAQESDTIRKDKRWPKFARCFGATSGTPTIDDVIRGFTQATPMTTSKTRLILGRLVEFASGFKDVGSGLAGLDPTKSAAAAWGCLQFIITAAIKAKNVHSLISDRDPIDNIRARYAVIADLYLHSSVLSVSLKDLLHESLDDLYTKVLKYLMISWDYLQHDKISHIRSSFSPNNAVKDAFDAVLKAEAKVRGTLEPITAQYIVDSAETNKIILQTLDHMSLPLQQAFEREQRVYIEMLERQRHDLLLWISDVTEGVRLQEVLKHHMPGTGLWFLHHPEYLRWRRGARPHLLWLKGKMGVGKSVLMALVISDMLQKSTAAEDGSCAYYMCDKTSPQGAREMSDIVNIYRCVLKQLLTIGNLETLSLIARLWKERQLDRLDGRKLTVTEALDFIRMILRQSKSITIIIDALDELSGDQRVALMTDLRRMQSEAHGTFRVLISSRPSLEISTAVAFLARQTVIETKNDDDLHFYVHARVHDRFERQLFPSKLLPHGNYIITEVLRKANGMFRWAAFALTYLEKPVLGNSRLLDRLNNLPPELADIYSLVFRELKEQGEDICEVFRNTVSLLMYQRVELSASETLEAVFGAKILREIDDPVTRLLTMCADFVEHDVSTNRLRLSHASVQEYFASQPEFESGRANASVAQLCFSSLEHFMPLKSWRLNEFVCYAICQWPWHVAQAANCQEERSNLIGSASRVSALGIPGSSIVTWFEQAQTLLRRKTTDVPTLFNRRTGTENSLSVGLGSLADAHVLVRRGSDVSLDRRSSLSSLISVASHGSSCYRSESEQFLVSPKDIMANVSNKSMKDRALITRKDAEVYDLKDGFLSVNTNPSNPLFAAAVWRIPELLWAMEPGQPEAWRQINLLRKPPLIVALHGSTTFAPDIFADMLIMCHKDSLEVCTGSGQTALHFACEQCNLDLAKSIVGQGAFGALVSIADQSGETPLHIVIRKGDAPMVRYLFRNGATLDMDDLVQVSRLWMAIAGAFFRGSPRQKADMVGIVDILAHESPALLHQTVNGYSLLHVAAEYESYELAKILVANGIYVDTKAVNSNGQTALHIAANGKVPSILNLLINTGADISVTDDNGMTPLHYAASDKAVERLVKKGANLEIRDHFNRTPLEAALARGASEAIDSFLWMLQRSVSKSPMNSVDWKELPLFLTQNISSTSAKILLKHGMTCCIGIDAKRPAKAYDDATLTRDSVDDAECVADKPGAPSISRPVSPALSELTENIDEDQEDIIRELRIEADERLEDLNKSVEVTIQLQEFGETSPGFSPQRSPTMSPHLLSQHGSPSTTIGRRRSRSVDDTHLARFDNLSFDRYTDELYEEPLRNIRRGSLSNRETLPVNLNESEARKHPGTFHCTLCSKSFSRAYNLRSHLRTHTEERPFECRVCGKAFARQHDRKRHESRHYGEKRFVCRGALGAGVHWGCGRCFARADALYRHFNSEAGRACIKPLLDGEAKEQGSAVMEANIVMMNERQHLIQSFAQNRAATLGSTYKALPSVLLQMYPALAEVKRNWDQLVDSDHGNSGRSSLDSSSVGEYYDEEENGVIDHNTVASIYPNWS